MITIRLLGGAKKFTGQELIHSTEPMLKVSDIMGLLQKDAKDPLNINFDNIIIAVNGVDCSILGGTNAIAKAGDEVTIVTAVHGG